jgi:hypothetical protein
VRIGDKIESSASYNCFYNNIHAQMAEIKSTTVGRGVTTTFVWRIENYSLLDATFGSTVHSDTFSVGAFKW